MDQSILKERSNFEQAYDEYCLFTENYLVKTLVNTTPNLVFIINQHRQIVFSNKMFTDFFALGDPRKLIGMRPGEVIGCIHSDSSEYGCGTSEECIECGALIAVLKVQYSNTSYKGETSVELKNGDTLNMLIWTSPLSFKNNNYVVVSVSDLSSKKRKNELERIFFHDVLNTVNALKNFFEIADDADEEDKKEISKITKTLLSELLLEIEHQRILTDSESGEYKIHIESFSIKKMINEIRRIFMLDGELCKRILLFGTQEDVILNSDKALVFRIIYNLLKNALEAVNDFDSIEIHFTQIKDHLEIRVINPTYIEANVQEFIFRKSFSTKGYNRGFGTYSIKLLTETYLKGKVSFTSTKIDGTEFTVLLPCDLAIFQKNN